MADYKITVTIDGQDYSQEQLAKISELRIKHVLAEMKALGAPIDLTDSHIQYLPYPEARKLLIEVKKGYDYEGMAELYAQPLKEADNFWHEVAEKSDGRNNLKEGKVYISAEGISMPQLQSVLGAELDSEFAYFVNPEHFYSEGDVAAGQRIIETFGCFGEPTAMTLHPEEHDFVPTEPDPSYPIKMNGYTQLASDSFDLDGAWRAYHQIRPTENGFDAILAAYLPSGAPDEMINGHKLHLAIEFSEMIKYALGDKEI